MKIRKEKNISVVNEEPHPDVDNIVNRHLSEYPEMADAVIASVKDTISAIDWWKKESAISRIVRDVTRILQSEMSVQKSKALANSIVKELIL